GLAAGILLARAGLKTVVVERNPQPGGRLVTRQFQRGFFASPFADDLPPVPADLFWSLDLARHGARVAETSGVFALWPDRAVALDSSAVRRRLADAGRRRAMALANARRIERPVKSWNPLAQRSAMPWPAEDWTHRTLAELATGSADEAAALMAAALTGRAADPLSAGSALLLLAPFQGGTIWRGGLGALMAALADSARAAGTEVSLGREVTDIRSARGRVRAIALADGAEISARAVISTLDLKRTFLTLFPWSELPPPAMKPVVNFRTAGAVARLLIALNAPPVPAVGNLPHGLLRGTLHLAPGARNFVAAHNAWQSGAIAQHLPLTVRVDSATDPSLAPVGGAVMTVTIGAVPHALFDGVWSREKRDGLTNRALSQIEEVFPALASSIVGTELFAPPDIEDVLGATHGDLDGGEIAPDQMFAFRPFADRKAPYTPVEGLYLAGRSATAAPLGGCVAGAVAAEAVIADIAAGKLP
ncbi:MAG: NAD(P)/FAD-dependent oxidoreductase, partial [Alphaproteobacteria bacterium]|nr:NAD(P)/FAD-dependent oxidoreductase [Alphaproteobacteria bacterium]